VEEKEIQEQLASIRGIMERSSKFISLSGLSGILAGIYALIGAGLAWNILYNSTPDYYITTTREIAPTTGLFYGGDIYALNGVNIKILLIALCVLVASLTSGIILTVKKAKQKGQPVWGTTSRALLFHMAVPLTTGGLFILILLFRGHYGILAATSLIFYGLALFCAGNFTFADIKYLGISEMMLGLIGAWLPGYGLLFWAIGFGVLHIIYGARIYLKYDR